MAWVTATYIVQTTIQLAYTIVNSRLVDPAGYATYAQAQVLTQVIQTVIVSAAGKYYLRVDLTHIAHASKRRQTLNLVKLTLAVNAVLGTLLFLTGHAELALVQLSLGVSQGLAAGSIIELSVATGLRRFSKVAVAQGGASLIATMVALPIVFLQPSSLSLTSWNLAYYGSLVLIPVLSRSWLLGQTQSARGEVSASSGRTSVRQMSISNLIGFALNSLPAWLLILEGKHGEDLSAWLRGFTLAVIPLNAVSMGLSNSLGPELAHNQNADNKSLDRYLARILALSGATVLGLVPILPRMTTLLLSPAWAPTAAIMPALSIWALWSLATALALIVLETRGEVKFYSLASLSILAMQTGAILLTPVRYVPVIFAIGQLVLAIVLSSRLAMNHTRSVVAVSGLVGIALLCI